MLIDLIMTSQVHHNVCTYNSESVGEEALSMFLERSSFNNGERQERWNTDNTGRH